MSIEIHAQAILDLCEKGPIPHGISLLIQEQAEGILDATKWTACTESLPKISGQYQIRTEDGRQTYGYYWPSSGFVDSRVVEWRESV